MTSGWTFLVARGRRQGHRARLVPEILAQLGLAGVVEQNHSVDTPAGRVVIVSRNHRIRPEDVGSQQVLDEHGRPLDIIYGFVCLDVVLGDIEEADLAAALAQALGTYRRFLADEVTFVTEVSPPFQLRSLATPVPPAAHLSRPSRAAVVLAVAGPLTVAVAAALMLVPRTTGPRTDDLTGTWQDPALTVTITCAAGCPVSPGTVIGTVRAAACRHTLALERPVDGTLQTTANRLGGTDCLPDGRITLRRTGSDSASLEWRDAGTGEVLRTAHLRRVDTPAST